MSVGGMILICIIIAPKFNLVQAQGQYGLLFDGANDYVDVSSLESFGTSSVTIEAWIKPEGFGGYNWIFSAGRIGDYPLVGANLNSSSRLSGYIEGDTTAQIATANDGDIMVAGNWYHVAVVFDRTTNLVTRYVSGVIVGTQNSIAALGSSPITTLGNAYIAASSTNSTNEHFDGTLDELRIWNTARTQQEIIDSMNQEIETSAGLMARWSFNEGIGSSITDTSGTNTTGEIHGAVWSGGKDLNSSGLTVLSMYPATVRPQSAVLNGYLDNLAVGTSANVYFRYGTGLTNMNTLTNTVLLSGTGAFYQTITGLSPQTNYYYQAVAEGIGISAYGVIKSFGINSVDLTGSNYVNAGDLTAIEGAGQLTVEAWVKGSDYNDAIAVSKHAGSTNGSFYLAYSSPSSIRFTTITNIGRVDHDVSVTLNSNWHHLAGVYDSSSQTTKIYYDGEQIGTTAVQSGTIKANTAPLIIGNYSPLDWPWNGTVDEVRIWNTARSANEIRDNMYSEIELATGLISRWGFNEGNGTTVEDTTGNGNTGNLSRPDWTTGYSHNAAPQITLIQPEDNSVRIGIATTLTASVSDNPADTLTVSLYGRQYSASDSNFTIVVLPDTQNYSSSYPATFLSQTNWITNNADDLNIQMVLHEGDVVNTTTTEEQWQNAMAALNVLSQNDIPNLISIGNHDHNTVSTRVTTTFNTNINYQNWYGSKDWFDGGTFEEGKSENVYTKKTIGSMKYIFMALEFGPRQEVIDWAKQVIENNQDHKVVIVTHSYMYSDDTRVGTGDSWNPHTYISSNTHDGDEMWTELVSQYENVFLVLSGHILNDGLGRLTSNGTNGNAVHQILSNYQMQSNGGDGWLRYYTFKPAEDKIYAYTYSPTRVEYEISADNQFILDYNFTPTDDYSLLSQVTDVHPVVNIAYNWANLTEGTQYEWYLTANDGLLSSTSPTWSFTTNTSPLASFSNDFNNWESGDVTVNYYLSDLDDATLDILQTDNSGIEYSQDGVNWYDATDGGGVSEGLTGLSANSDHIFVWDSSTDLANTEDNSVYLRIRPNDGVSVGTTWTQSEAFGIDNASPSSVGVPGFGAVTHNTIEITKPLSVNENGSGLYQWRFRRNSTIESVFVGIATTSIVDSGLAENTLYTYDVRFTDNAGLLSTYGQTAQKYTSAATPTNPSASLVSQDSITITVDSFLNDSVNLSGYLFSRTGSNSGWIQTNSWIDDGLSCGTTYSYSIKYRNSEGVETDAVNLSQATQDCDPEPTPTDEPTPTSTSTPTPTSTPTSTPTPTPTSTSTPTPTPTSTSTPTPTPTSTSTPTPTPTSTSASTSTSTTSSGTVAGASSNSAGSPVSSPTPTIVARTRKSITSPKKSIPPSVTSDSPNPPVFISLESGLTINPSSPKEPLKFITRQKINTVIKPQKPANLIRITIILDKEKRDDQAAKNSLVSKIFATDLQKKNIF